jgi:hypothetical protein
MVSVILNDRITVLFSTGQHTIHKLEHEIKSDYTKEQTDTKSLKNTNRYRLKNADGY